MDDYLELSLASIARANGLVNSGTVELFETLCTFLVLEGLLETEDFLLHRFNELSDLHSRHGSVRVALLQLYAVIKQAETLVHKCCESSNPLWPERVLPLLGFKEDMIDILLHLRWWESITDMLIQEYPPGLSQEEVQGAEVVRVKRANHQFEETLENLTSRSNELQEAPVRDKELLLKKIEELQGSYSGQPGTREHRAYLLSFQVQSLLMDRDVSEISELNRYTFKDSTILGSGSYGAVLQVEWFGFDCALKVFNGVHVRNEAESLKRCHHPNIVQCYRHWEPLGDNNSLMLMERMPKDLEKHITKVVDSGTASSSRNSGTVDTLIMPFSNPVAIDVMMQVAKAMWHIHSKNVIHRDLKPRNVLVRQVSEDEVPELFAQGFLHVKLGDFGLARDDMMSSNDHELTLNAGSTMYRAPELSSEEYVTGRNYPRKVDVWSFGIMCAEILRGRLVFSEHFLRLSELKLKLVNDQIRPQLPKSCPDYLKVCIERCWKFEPKDRPRFSEIWKVLRFAKLRSLGLLQQNYDLFTFEESRTHLTPKQQPATPSTVMPPPPSVPPLPTKIKPQPLVQPRSQEPTEMPQSPLPSRFATVIPKPTLWFKKIVSAFGPSSHQSEDKPLGYLVNTVVPHESESNSKLDVIFFEGNVGRRKYLSCKDTWVQRGKPHVCWPQDWLAKDFKGDVRVLLLEYSISGPGGIDGVVDKLQRLLVFSDRWNRGHTWQRPIVLVGHSLGCIVIEQLVVALDKRVKASGSLKDEMENCAQAKVSKAFLASLAGCFFYAPPLKGLVASEGLLEHVFGGLSYSKALFADLCSDSTKLTQLSEKFMQARSERVKLMALTEGFHTLGRKVVPPASMGDFAGTVEELGDSNHTEICKPINNEHQAYWKLVEFIWDILYVN